MSLKNEKDELRRDSFVFKTAFTFTEKDKIPQGITRCRLFWQFNFFFFIGIPLYQFIILLCRIGGFFFANRVMSEAEAKGAGTEDLFIKYEKWPKIKGKRIYPFWVLALFLLTYYVLLPTLMNVATTDIVPWGISTLPLIKDFLIKILIYSGAGAILLFSAFLSGLIFKGIALLLFNKEWKEVATLTKDWIKDRKEGLCPWIPIEPA